MPSDCQCSTSVEVVEKTRVIGSKEATRRLRKLEAEVKKLKRENARLRRLANEKEVTKKELVRKLKRQLDRLT